MGVFCCSAVNDGDVFTNTGASAASHIPVTVICP